ncbi:MAG: undecaprenyl-phosphate glucose phosphotransferase [Dysgonamonadaceae bacterium]|jgi:putative colanic acid biosynthesis UDP-glucose lipid carrier transferase|nr:undecaprenyl-phosphate glucose phosphotransferase [Dysgonamonadaceae bacterium]
MVKEKTRYGFMIKWLIIIGDLFIFNLTFYIIFKWLQPGGQEMANLRLIVLLLNLSYIFAVYFVPVKIYKPVMFIDKVIQRSIYLVALHAIIFLAGLYFLKLDTDVLPRYFIVVYYAILLIAFTLYRVVTRESLKLYRKKGRNFKRVIIVGAGKNGMNLYAEMKKEMAYGYYIFGFFDDNVLLKNSLPNYLGMTHEVEKFALDNDVDEIYCTLPNSQDEKILRIFNFCEKNMIRFYIVPEFSRYVKKQLVLESIEAVPVMAVRHEPLQFIVNRFFKRTFDIIFSLIFLIAIFPILYIIFGIIIKLSSPGPVIFKQTRTGIYGKNFECYKFRSMRRNEEADEKQAEKGDPRTTAIGQFLRRSNLDEIPQFYNVLKGDMSVVGPRPHMLKHTELYSSVIDKYMVRHLIKPGITGWAQVNGYRGETRTMDQMEGRIRYDVWYLENWSFILDLKIILVTILNMFKGEKNAY